MPRIADRRRETTVTTGTGTIDLAGATVGYSIILGGRITTGSEVYYTIAHRTLSEWEDGIGTITDATPDTLSRTRVIESSNAGSLVNFSAGTKDVFITVPAEAIFRMWPDLPPTTPGTVDDEFDSTSLKGQWTETTVGSTTRDIDTTWPSNYYWTGDGSADQSRTLECTLSSTAGNALGITVYARNVGIHHGSSNVTMGIYLDKDGAYTDYNAIIVTGRVFRHQQSIASAPTDYGSYTMTSSGTSAWYHLQRTAGNVWSAWYSHDGYTWVLPVAGISLSQNVGKLKITMRNNTLGLPTQHGFDWVRQNWRQF